MNYPLSEKYMTADLMVIVNRSWNKCDLQIYQFFSTILQILTHWF